MENAKFFFDFWHPHSNNWLAASESWGLRELLNSNTLFRGIRVAMLKGAYGEDKSQTCLQTGYSITSIDTSLQTAHYFMNMAQLSGMVEGHKH